MSKTFLLFPALVVLGLSTAPILPTTYLSQENSEIPNYPHQVMAAPAMEAPQASTVAIEAVYEPTRTPTPTPQPVIHSSPASGSIATMFRERTAARFGAGQVDAMMQLVGHESGLNPYAVNPSSGACGLPQALPCSKLLAVIGSLDNVSGQVDWMIDYIARRYYTPSQALAFWHCIGYCTDNYGTHKKSATWY